MLPCIAKESTDIPSRSATKFIVSGWRTSMTHSRRCGMESSRLPMHRILIPVNPESNPVNCNISALILFPAQQCTCKNHTYCPDRRNLAVQMFSRHAVTSKVAFAHVSEREHLTLHAGGGLDPALAHSTLYSSFARFRAVEDSVQHLVVSLLVVALAMQTPNSSLSSIRYVW